MRRAWILVNLGTPTAPTAAAVRAFLAEFLADPLVVDLPAFLWRPILRGIVLRTRPARVAKGYAAIWTPEGSPLAAWTKRLAKSLAERVEPGLDVHAAYRYGESNRADGIDRIDRVLARALDTADQVVVRTLFPHPTAASSGTIEALVRATAARLGAADRVVLAPLAPDAPGYVAAQVERIEAAERRLAGGRADCILLSFHGLPARVDRREGGRYSRACAATAAAVAARLGRPAAEIVRAYQSRFGPGAWLKPATADLLVARAAAGARRVVVATPGFLTPGLETLEELGLRGRADFLRAGGVELRLADPPTDHPAFLDELVALVVSRRLSAAVTEP
jgi:ferrochelatase